YLNLEAGQKQDSGRSATIGIKEAGLQGGKRLLISFNGPPNDYFGTGKSTRIGVHIATATDVYALHLDAGQPVTAALKALSPESFRMNLLDDSGAVLASAASGPANLDRLIDSF